MSSAFFPIKAINKLSKELEKRGMLIPAEIMLNSVLEERADIPLNAIHLHIGLKAESAIETFPRCCGDPQVKEKRT